MLRSGGVIEVAVRNPNVSAYMEAWEARTIKAEAEVERLRAALTDIATNDQLYNERAMRTARKCLAGETFPKHEDKP